MVNGCWVKFVRVKFFEVFSIVMIIFWVFSFFEEVVNRFGINVVFICYYFGDFILFGNGFFIV